MNPPRPSTPPRMPTIPPSTRLPVDNGCEPQRHPPATRPVRRFLVRASIVVAAKAALALGADRITDGWYDVP